MFQLCGETPADLSKASALINSLINQEHINITIHDPAIAHFTKEDLEMMSKMEKELKVSVITGKKGQDSVITLKGLTGFVQTAESRIRDIIRKVERNEHRKILAALTSSIVEWQYKSGHNFKAFDIFTNCDLEEAFKLQTTSVQIRIDSEMYNADIVRKIATKGRKRTELKRVELKAAAQSFLPSNWEDMKGQSVVLVKLTAGSKEYADVEKEFKKTGLSSNIIKIERVQNSALWRYYIIKKEQLEEKNQHKNNEKCLFHGTGPDTTDQINNHGFNRSFAGMHGALYGNGTYFAVDPSYSAQGYSKPDAKGHKCMYLARVLVGDFTQGRKGLLTPPNKSSKGVHFYDSVTDKTNNPSMFVIFSDEVNKWQFPLIAASTAKQLSTCPMEIPVLPSSPSSHMSQSRFCTLKSGVFQPRCQLVATARQTSTFPQMVSMKKASRTTQQRAVNITYTMFQCLGLKKGNRSETTIEETVHVKSHAVAEFIKDRKSQDWQNLVKSDEVKVSFDPKRPCIKLSGERTFVQPAVTCFKSLANDLYTDTLIIKKAGAKKYFMEPGKIMLSMFARENGFVAVLQEDDMLEEEKDSKSTASSFRFKVYTMQIGHLTLKVSPGDITKEKTDAIVNSSNKNFTLKSGVSKAILDGAGSQVEKELSKMAKDTNDEETEIVTSSGNLPCKKIIHIVGCNSPDDIQEKVLSALMLCENHKFSSVAFPALGTGEGEVEPAKAADAMITAVVEFASKKTNYVKNVEFLIFQSSMLADFHENMLKITKSRKSLISRIKGKNIVFKEIEPAVFQLCSETPECLSKASAIINGLITKEQINNTICDPAIAYFTKKELKLLSKMEKELKVSIITEKKGKDFSSQTQTLPLHWEDMKGQSVVLVKVTAGSEEFTDVEKEFRKTGQSNNIIKSSEQRTLEKLHDQKGDHGFNRSFAGMNGAIYGKGTYFAVDPSYSAKNYSKPDAKGHKRMYLARVLVGDFTQGKKGLVTPPKRKSKGVHLYDSVTDKIKNPSMFVIFNDVQAYPEYLITFRKK
ncbi:Protein mono-ADP-ribosyltransferase PARP14 [Labeo rohita]|uniref:Poly [ADP-ribose] polymerase n=1 Tax=Labeo rohita TaxID=84645 RepID=A0ABQ8MCC3_LABRO|nr:Protein mono-ADP-ribosyltransferase PARP14 [Labeo rohita]